MNALDSQIKIGTLLLDVETNQLIVDGCVQQIEPRLVAVLLFLYQHQNQVVNRQQLIDVVWNGQVVSDNAISRSISQIRKLLKQTDYPHPLIETIPRVGYRLKLESKSDFANDKQQLLKINNKNASSQSAKVVERIPFVKLPDKNSLKVVLFLAFSLAIFGRYFYQQFFQSETSKQFIQSSLTLSPGPEKLPKISPDSRWLAFAEANQEGDGEYLFATSLDSNQKIKLSESSSYLIDIAWSPDSKSIVYSSWKSVHDRGCSVRLLRLENKGGALLKPISDESLFDCSDRAATRLAWHELGNKIYFTSRPSYDRPYFIQSYSLDSKRLEQITLPPQSGNLRGDYYISGSLTGKYLAIVRYLGSNLAQLKIYDTGEKNFIATQMLDSSISALAWSEDERLLILKQNNLYWYDYDSNQEKFFYSIGKNSGGLTANKSGERIAFTVLEKDINLVQYQRNSSHKGFEQKAALAESSAIEVVPSFSNDQTQVAFLSNRTGSNQIWLADGEGGIRQLSDSPISLTLSPLNWSPDDELVLFQHHDEIYTIGVKTGKIERIIEQQHLVANADWSYDGSSIFYSSEKSGEWQIWQYHLTQKSHRQITVYGGYSAKQDSDGSLYVSRIHQDGLWKLNYDSKNKKFATAKLILAEFSGTNWLSWQLLGNKIYYFGSINNTSNETKFGIMQLDLNDHSTNLWFPFDSSHQRHFSVSTETLIVTRVTRNEGSIELLTSTELSTNSSE